MSLSRRTLLQAAAGAAALSAMEPLPADAAEPDFPIIDTHQHLWDLKTLRVPWLSDPGAAKIATRHDMEVYLHEAAGTGIVKSVYMEIDAAEEDEAKEADFVIATCKGGKTPMRKGVISGRPGTPAFAAFAERYRDVPYIRGFRQILHPPERPKGLCLEPQFVKSVRLLGEMGKSYDICIRPGELADGAKLAELCPGTRFVLDHCGNGDAAWNGKGPEYDAWAAGIKECAKRRNIICKLSGVIRNCKPDTPKAEQLKPLAHHVLESFGADRVIWASDWPVCEFGASLKEWVEVARALTAGLSAVDQRKVFHDNSAKFYGV